MKRLFAPFALLFLLGVIFVACDETPTGDLPESGTVTFNITVPYYDETSGDDIRADIWSDAQTDSPIYTVNGTITNGTLSLDIAEVDTGLYAFTVSIDIQDDGFGDNDLVWAAIDVQVTGDETITVGQYGWQWVEGHVITFGVRGIPSGNSGAIFALGIFEDGTDIFADSLEPIFGGSGLVYGTSALIFTTYDNNEGDTSSFELPSGNYDALMLLDLDGSMEDWFGMDGGSNGNPITNGDYIASYNLIYDAGGTFLPISSRPRSSWSMP